MQKWTDTMTQFNNTVKNVETFKVRKGGSNIAASSICCLAMFHKNTLKYFYIDDLPDTACVKHLAKDCKNLRQSIIIWLFLHDYLPNFIRMLWFGLLLLFINVFFQLLISIPQFTPFKAISIFSKISFGV